MRTFGLPPAPAPVAINAPANAIRFSNASKRGVNFKIVRESYVKTKAIVLKHFIITTLACAVSKVNYCSGDNLKSLGTILPWITIMINEELKHIFQSWKRQLRLGKKKN